MVINIEEYIFDRFPLYIKMSCKQEKRGLEEVNEPAVIESLKCLDMNAKESENTKIEVNNSDEKGIN